MESSLSCVDVLSQRSAYLVTDRLAIKRQWTGVIKIGVCGMLFGTMIDLPAGQDSPHRSGDPHRPEESRGRRLSAAIVIAALCCLLGLAAVLLT